MNFDNLTDSDINELLSITKEVTNPNVQWKNNRGSKQKNFKVTGGDYLFRLYLRQNLFDEKNFSCGLSIIKPDRQALTLLRYNGANHAHLEIKYACHMHKATERAISEGRKPEYYANQADKYESLEGALYCLCQDANISGLSDLKPDHPDLFK